MVSFFWDKSSIEQYIVHIKGYFTTVVLLFIDESVSAKECTVHESVSTEQCIVHAYIRSMIYVLLGNLDRIN